MSIDRYRAFLNSFPRPGGGGAHIALFKAGCFGSRAGLDVETVIADVRKNMPAGGRHVSDDEIDQGVRAGFADVEGGSPPSRRAAPRIAPGTLERLIRDGKGTTEADLRARSPIPLDWPEHEGWRVLESLYGPEELLFLGDDGLAGRLGDTIRPVAEWASVLKEVGSVPCPKIMVNPLTGKPALKKSGVGTTLRGDSCVAAHRYAVAEHDQLDLASQLAFWMAVPLPVAALVFSGKKSIHGWVRVDCADADEWKSQIEEGLFPKYLVPMGLDPSCRNCGRLSRTPGHRRQADTGLVQRCLYLAPEGKAVAA